ncbi:hypothetical protein SynA18461_00349 [Synechococcus sp. A18-46.1]|nr:hypothetical protein SynA18461_00349 [Synechococcus sp. A18-46.1]
MLINIVFLLCEWRLPSSWALFWQGYVLYLLFNGNRAARVPQVV